MITLLKRALRWLWPKTPSSEPTQWWPFDDASEPSEPAHPIFTDPTLLEAGHQVIAYPDKIEEPSAQDWVTGRLRAETGGLTRHPYDLTNYPTPPTPEDLAAREWAARNARGPKALFSHGYSMQYLGRLLDRAKRKDPTLTTEELMSLRSRGLI